MDTFCKCNIIIQRPYLSNCVSSEIDFRTINFTCVIIDLLSDIKMIREKCLEKKCLLGKNYGLFIHLGSPHQNKAADGTTSVDWRTFGGKEPINSCECRSLTIVHPRSYELVGLYSFYSTTTIYQLLHWIFLVLKCSCGIKTCFVLWFSSELS